MVLFFYQNKFRSQKEKKNTRPEDLHHVQHLLETPASCLHIPRKRLNTNGSGQLLGFV